MPASTLTSRWQEHEESLTGILSLPNQIIYALNAHTRNNKSVAVRTSRWSRVQSAGRARGGHTGTADRDTVVQPGGGTNTTDRGTMVQPGGGTDTADKGTVVQPGGGTDTTDKSTALRQVVVLIRQTEVQWYNQLVVVAFVTTRVLRVWIGRGCPIVLRGRVLVGLVRALRARCVPQWLWTVHAQLAS